jgi:integrase
MQGEEGEESGNTTGAVSVAVPALTNRATWQRNAYRIIQRRAADAGIKTRIGNHTFRATGITAYLKNSGKLEIAQHIANHESPRTTKFFDRRQDETSLDEVERIAIWS